MNPFQALILKCLGVIVWWVLWEMIYQYQLFHNPYQLGMFKAERIDFYERAIPLAIKHAEADHNEVMTAALKNLQARYWRAEV